MRLPSYSLLFAFAVFNVVWHSSAVAQSIVPIDSAVTTVTPTDALESGETLLIEGGSSSGDGAALFHSFSEFGVATGTEVFFLVPEADTTEALIVGISGNSPSFINGIIGLTDSASVLGELTAPVDLFLLNPNGILLGENARIDISGSLSLTTATGLAFGDALYDVLGDNDFSQIAGSPTGYVFGAEQAGLVVSSGDLETGFDESVTLIGGQVINTGPLVGDNVVVQTVSGGQFVRISQTDMLLSLEIETIPSGFEPSSSAAFTVSTLAELLTGADDLGIATDIFIDSEGDFVLNSGGDDVGIFSNDDINISAIFSSGGEVVLSADGTINIPVAISTAPSGEEFSEESSSDIVLSAGEAIFAEGLLSTNCDGELCGDITLTAPGPIAVGDVSTDNSGVGDSGGLEIVSQTSITANDISTLSSGGDSGDVVLDPPGDVVFSSIDTSSTAGTGGDVTVVSTDGTVRGVGISPFTAGATIATGGAVENGSITIIHGGGSSIPFDIGDASVNGVAGTLDTGATVLADGDSNEPFFGTFSLGEIQLISEGEIVSETVANPPFSEVLCVNDCSVPNEIPESVDDGILTARTLSNPALALLQIEERLTSEYLDYLDAGLAGLAETGNVIDLPTAQTKLLDLQRQTGRKPALIYAVFGSNAATRQGNEILSVSAPTAPLEILLITAEGDPVYLRLPDVTREKVITTAQQLRRQVSTPSRTDSQSYLPAAQQLYQWLLPPAVQAQLTAQGVDTLSFITDAGLRTTPLAALHDGENFIIERYNVGLMPSLSLTNLTYRDLRDVGALAAGTTSFASQAPLFGVSVELRAITKQWSGTRLQGEAFTLEGLARSRRQTSHGILHLATHGEFRPGSLSQSSLYLYDQRLGLHELRQFGLHDPPLELLTLSACQTAVGNRSAELGFAGFAVLTGAKTSVASLWNVSDDASAGLMIEFYNQLRGHQPTIKAEALKQAQLTLLHGQVYIQEDQLVGPKGRHPLPPELTIDGIQDFSHPYYWAAFSLVGSPW